MTNTTGGAAFPQSTTIGSVSETVGGMTLRDWFAGQALAGLLVGYITQYGAPMNTHDEVFSLAYKAADAMIQARETE